ncbi:MAG: hypothetical protein KatS3mg087_0258 [Patescibacteria group bacterium]|nr:MAG: hypothetical protein KatS3mg087_0258 [Patescibacteria group bacterium]
MKSRKKYGLWIVLACLVILVAQSDPEGLPVVMLIVVLIGIPLFTLSVIIKRTTKKVPNVPLPKSPFPKLLLIPLIIVRVAFVVMLISGVWLFLNYLFGMVY